MKDLLKYANLCMDYLDAIEVPYGNVISWKVNTRATRRWGQCTHHLKEDTYEIEIAKVLLEDTTSEKSLIQTICHELCHACPNCDNHGTEWKKWADLVSSCYDLNIKRCSSSKELGCSLPKRKVENKWVFTCPSCDKEWKYQRRPKWVSDGYEPMTNKMVAVKCPCCRGGIYMTSHGDLSGIQRVYQF